MIKSFKIDNFKALNDFQLPASGDGELGHFVCLVGLNGAGKSTVLQAFDFLSQLVVGDIASWLAARGWSKGDLTSKQSKRRNISFELRFRAARHIFEWRAIYNSQLGRCTKEELRVVPDANLKDSLFPTEEVSFSHDGSVFRTTSGYKRELLSDFDGSIFNKLKVGEIEEKSHRMALHLFRICLDGIKSLELLNPNAMRRPSKKAVDVGLGGEDLAAFVHGFDKAEAAELNGQISKIYPHVKNIRAKAAQYGWKRLQVSESFLGNAEFDARHANDGLLRVAAIIAQTVAEDAIHRKAPEVGGAALGNPDQKGYDVLLLDEIENGINPEVIRSLVSYLSNVRQQVIFTTHSPMILNYLDDDVASDSVFLVHRRADGSSCVTRFYTIESVRERLEVMGPGEAFADVSLTELSKDSGRYNRVVDPIW